MTKANLFWSSFVAAVPGAFLFYLMLMAVFRHMEGMPGLLKGVALVALVMALAVFAFPAYIFVWYGGYMGLGAGKKKRQESAGGEGAAVEEMAPAAEDPVAEEAAADEVGHDAFEETGTVEEADLSDAELGETDEVVFEPSGDLQDDFEFEEFDDEEK